MDQWADELQKPSVNLQKHVEGAFRQLNNSGEFIVAAIDTIKKLAEECKEWIG